MNKQAKTPKTSRGVYIKFTLIMIASALTGAGRRAIPLALIPELESRSKNPSTARRRRKCGRSSRQSLRKSMREHIWMFPDSKPQIG